MATVSSLNIKLSANSAELQKDLAKSRKKVGKWAKDVKSSALRAGAAFGLMAGASSAALIALTKSSLDQIDTLGKHADRLNASTEGLAGLRHQAELTGTSYSTLDKALGQMVKRLGEARQGSGEAKKFLEAMNIDFQRLSELKADEQYSAIADGISKLGNATDQAAAANAIFGRSGIDMLAQLKEGSKGFAAATAEAEALGLSLSRVDAAMVEEANDAMTRMKRVATGLGNTIAVKVSPFIKAIADRFTEAGKESKGFVNEVEAGMDIATKALGFVLDRVQDIARGFLAIKAATQLANTKYKEFADGFGDIIGAERQAEKAAAELQTTLDKLFNSVNGGRASEKLKAEIADIKEAARLARIELEAEFAKNKGAGGSEGELGGGGTVTKEDTQLTNLRNSLKTQMQLEKDAYKERKELATLKLTDATELKAALQIIEAQHAEKMGELTGLPALQRDLQAARIMREQAGFSERQKEIEGHQLRVGNLALLREQDLENTALYNQTIEAEEALHQERMTAIKKREDAQQLADTKKNENIIQGFKKQTANLAMGLLSQVANRSKGAAIALLAIEAARGVSQALINSQVAATRALAELGPIAGPPVAAQMLAYGKISAGLILAQKSLQMGSVGGGASPTTGGGYGSPYGERDYVNQDNQQQYGQGTGTSVQIIMQGDSVNWTESVQANVIEMIKDAVDNKDAVIIGSGSAQAGALSG